MFNIFRPRHDRLLREARLRLDLCTSRDSIVDALRTSARAIAAADGITVVKRIGDEVAYIGEDAISPLWTGQSFPMRMCISGMAIAARAPIVIPDIMQDKRVPLNAYLSTFVRSMAMVPVGHGEPTLAMGAYWREARPIAPLTVDRMRELAGYAADALDHLNRTALAVA